MPVSDYLDRILPEDKPALKHFVDQVTKEDLYYRYFSEINEFIHNNLANMMQLDYDREMAFLAIRGEEIIGMTHSLSDQDNTDLECAAVMHSDLKRWGLGQHQLLEKIITYARTRIISL